LTNYNFIDAICSVKKLIIWGRVEKPSYNARREYATAALNDAHAL